MKNKLLFAAFFILASTGLLCAQPVAPASDRIFGRILSTEELHSDFITLKNALLDAHSGLYRFSSPAEINKLFDTYQKRLKHPMDIFRFDGLLCEMLARIGDGHMRIDYNEAELAKEARPLLMFPFTVLLDKTKMIVLYNDTKDVSAVEPGMEIVRINGHTLADIEKKILPKLITDGSIETRKTALLERNFSSYYFRYADTCSVFRIEIKDRTGKSKTMTVRGVENRERTANRNLNPVNRDVLTAAKPLDGPDQNLSLELLNDSTAKLRIRLFDGKRFSAEADSLFGILNNNKRINKLILDLRGNGGGLDHLSAHLISKFVTEQFRYMDHIHTRVLIPSYAPWKDNPPVDLAGGTVPAPEGGYRLTARLNNCLALQKPSTAPFTGKLIILTDGRTFSAASDAVSLLKHLTGATVVGQETGGGAQGNTSGLNALLTLPHSGLIVNIHLWDYWTAVPPPEIKGRGTIPDYPVDRDPLKWINGIDNQLEFALELN